MRDKQEQVSHMPEAAQITTTVLIADVCSSTRIFNQLGDELAANLISRILKRTADIIESHGGLVLRSKGDDVLCIFPSPVNALQAALSIHASMRNPSTPELPATDMRIGVNSGAAILDAGDIQGDSVNIAARLSALAKEGQTLVSTNTLKLLEGLPPGLIRFIGKVSLKGKSGLLEVFELLDLREQEEITQVGSTPLLLPQSNRLSIHFQSRHEKMDYLLVRFLLGRNPDCDLVLDHPLVSRHHAEIRYQNNEFVLIDFSTNGTTLIINGRSSSLHHSQAALRGRGSIFLGGTLYNKRFEIAFHASGGVRAFN
jgi:adenylate cyclase